MPRWIYFYDRAYVCAEKPVLKLYLAKMNKFPEKLLLRPSLRCWETLLKLILCAEIYYAKWFAPNNLFPRRCLALEKALNLNVDKGPIVSRNLFLRFVFMFCQKTGVKTKHRQTNNPSGDLFLRFDVMFVPKNGFKTKHRQRAIFVRRWYFYVCVRVFRENGLKLNVGAEINPIGGLFHRRCLVTQKKRF